MDIIIDIPPNGKATALHFDEFPLTFLGEVAVTRATEITFDNRSQLWQVILPGQRAAYPVCQGFLTYQQARHFEVDWLTHCQLAGVAPLSSPGEQLAQTRREQGDQGLGREISG